MFWYYGEIRRHKPDGGYWTLGQSAAALALRDNRYNQMQGKRAMSVAIGGWRRLAAVSLSLAAFPASPAQAPPLSSTSVMAVTIEIATSCALSASDLEFGAYRPESPAPALGQTVIQLLCAPGTTAELLLDAGMGAARNTRRRQMTQDAGTDRMDYDLYQDAGRTTHWGDRSGRDTVEVLTTGAQQTVTVYGEIPGGQRVRQGTYSDVITVQLLF
jgi:spore coat protein U-like protein